MALRLSILADGRFVSLQDLQLGVGAYIPTLLEREDSPTSGASRATSPVRTRHKTPNVLLIDRQRSFRGE
jgi:hypothetical protein